MILHCLLYLDITNLNIELRIELRKLIYIETLQIINGYLVI